jgi:hypothetical protein
VTALTLNKKKWLLTVAIFVCGTVLAFTADGTSLGEYTAFGAFLIGVFGAADVMDKKLNGGEYDSK